MSQQQSISTVPAFFPEDYELREVRNDDGSISYRHPVVSDRIMVYNDNLESLISLDLQKLENVADRISGEAEDPVVGYIFEALIEHSRNMFYEVFRFLEREYDSIICTRICKNQYPYRSDRVVSVTVTPKEAAHE